MCTLVSLTERQAYKQSSALPPPRFVFTVIRHLPLCVYRGAKVRLKSVAPPDALVKRNIHQQLLVRTTVHKAGL